MYTFFRILFTAAISAALLTAAGFLPPASVRLLEQLRTGPAPLPDPAAACALVLFVWCFLAPLPCRLFGSLRFRIFSMSRIRKQIQSRRDSLLNWLLARPAYWGITGTASDPQYATTCEGLLAIHSSGYYEKKRESRRIALQTLVDAAVPTGLPSRTVNRPTVINTSMLLMIAMQEKKSSGCVVDSFDLFDEMASNLWFLRAENGWGPLVLKAERKECRFVNTWWALRALYHYGYYDRPEEGDSFRQLVSRTYEKNRGGTFGYTASDSPRLAVTAMYLLFFYELPASFRKEIEKDYNPRSAAAFILRRFVTEKRQVEIESVDGTFAGGSFIAHTPWKHISSSYAMQALAAARKNNDLRRKEMEDVYRRTSEILSQDLRSPAPNESFYLPADAEIPRTGPYTFAAAHLILGLQAMM